MAFREMSGARRGVVGLDLDRVPPLSYNMQIMSHGVGEFGLVAIIYYSHAGWGKVGGTVGVSGWQSAGISGKSATASMALDSDLVHLLCQARLSVTKSERISRSTFPDPLSILFVDVLEPLISHLTRKPSRSILEQNRARVLEYFALKPPISSTPHQVKQQEPKEQA